MTLTNKIRVLRFENGEMTQKKLAESVGVSRQTMNAIENGKHAPTVDIAIRIADVFGITVDELFECTYEGKPKRRPAAPAATAVRKEPTIEKPIDEPTEEAKREEEVEPKLTLASLRHVIGD